jgi:hypothetical protein
MTVKQFDLKLFMYKLWLTTNPPMNEIILENAKMADQAKSVKYGRHVNRPHINNKGRSTHR